MGNKISLKGVLGKVGHGVKKASPWLILLIFLGFVYVKFVKPALIAKGLVTSLTVG